MPELGCGSVQLLNVDPELARELDPRRAREAAQRLYARVIDIPRGRWTPGPGFLDGTRPIGLLIIEGLLVREATVGDHPSAELLGPGDLLRAWEDADSDYEGSLDFKTRAAGFHGTRRATGRVLQTVSLPDATFLREPGQPGWMRLHSSRWRQGSWDPFGVLDVVGVANHGR